MRAFFLLCGLAFTWPALFGVLTFKLSLFCKPLRSSQTPAACTVPGLWVAGC